MSTYTLSRLLHRKCRTSYKVASTGPLMESPTGEFMFIAQEDGAAYEVVIRPVALAS